MLSLRKNRDELQNVREEILNTQEKEKTLNKACVEMDNTLNELSQKVEEKNVLIDTLNKQVNEKTSELNRLDFEVEEKRKSRENIISDYEKVKMESEMLQQGQNTLERNIHGLKETVNQLQRLALLCGRTKFFECFIWQGLIWFKMI